jgi:hypothetical protein
MDIGYGSFLYILGDELWVLENGKVPFLLKGTGKKNEVLVLGEAYLDGVMGGELFVEWKPEWRLISLV